MNPVYSWDGLATAVYIWNKAVELNNASSVKPLGDITGFCDETDLNLRSMTLSAFLANATVESAYFLVCKESTILNTKPPVNCPGTTGKTSGADRFNPRYCNNCDQANPKTYSCQGGAGGGGGGTCSLKKDSPITKDNVCNTPGCYATNGKNICNVSNDGITWASWDDSIVPTEGACDAENYKYKFWCSAQTPTPTPPGPTPPPFNPTKDNCTGGWPTCQISSPFKLPDIAKDPCMSDPQGDGSFNNPLDNNKPRCSDWNGNPWDQQQDCYFGRGLVQLTWSCNYYKVQSIYTRMSKLFSNSSSGDPILQKFITSMDPKNMNASNSCNVCANPDVLCGDYTLNGNTIVYSTDIIKQAIPWLSCIAYWVFAVNPHWLKCYSFRASVDGIAPSGSSAYPDRLSAYNNLLNIMNVDKKYYTQNTAKDNTCLSVNIKSTCKDCSSGGGGGSCTKLNYCTPKYDTDNACNYPTSQTPDDCTKAGVTSLCYPSATCPSSKCPHPK